MERREGEGPGREAGVKSVGWSQMRPRQDMPKKMNCGLWRKDSQLCKSSKGDSGE